MNLADDRGVAHLLALVGWDVLVVNEEEGVGACYLLTIRHRTRSNALAQAAYLIGIGGIPSCLVTGVTTKLAML
jgi:hypothetical protein